MKNRPFFLRLGYALSGIIAALRQENSLKTQAVFAVMAFVALLVLQPEPIWWALVIVMMALVMAAELFNTALEALCDYVQPEHHATIGYIKDVAAGAVWLLSVAAAVVGVLMIYSTLPNWQ
ncbi:MAG: diacylglycerol kinase [Gammaproteobacteria bacterium]|nr:diacylglycerol kinase [Gammaproteobacteria bacterium]